MPLYQAIVLAVIQGLTEFLPVSSTAHLALVPQLFHWADPGLGFDVALHVVFTDRAAHDAYQADATHDRFIAEMKHNWAKVRVFDSLVERV